VNEREASLERLERAFEALVAVPFPEHPDSDELDDAMMPLLELDAYYAGLADSTINGSRARHHPLHELRRLREALARAPVSGERDARIQARALERVELLERVRTELAVSLRSE
jgi:hypothetical protein